MISIANKKIEINLPSGGESNLKVTINDISYEDEFDLDMYYGLFVKAEQEDDDRTIFEFVKDTLKTKESLLEFISLAKRIVPEFADSPYMEIVIKFYSIIYLIQLERVTLKKK